MQCLSCSKTFATELSVCPSCGKMPTQHTRAAIVAASRRAAAVGSEETFETKTPTLPETAFAAPAPAQQLNAPESSQGADQQFQPAPKKEFMSTLIEFPKRTKTPEWRDAVRERVQASKERRQCEPEQQPHGGAAKPAKAAKTKTTAEEPTAAAGGAQPQSAMVIDLKPNIERPANRLLARALERVERSRQAYQNPLGAEDEQLPQTSETMFAEIASNGQSKIGAKTILAPVPAFSAPGATRKVLPPVDDFAEPSAAETFKPARKETEKIVENSIETIEGKTLETTAEPLPADKREPAASEPKSNKIPILSITSDADADRFLESSLPPVAGATKKELRSKPRNVIAEQEVLPRARQRDAATLADDYAPLFGRTLAGALDLALCAGAAFLIVAPFVSLQAFAPENLTTRTMLTTICIFAAVKFVYLTLGLTLSETTVGLRLFGLRIVHAEDASAPTLVEAAINSSIYLLTLAAGGIALAAVLFSPEKRGFHDLLSGTVAVRDN